MGALLVLQLLTATFPPDIQRSVWLIERPGWQRQESALLEALRIYTSDLKAAVTLKPDEAKGNTPTAQLRAAQDRCSSKVSMVAWFTGDAKQPVLRILRCATLFADQLPCPRYLSVESLAQTLALKIRALLAQEPELRLGNEAPDEAPDKAPDETSQMDADEIDGLASMDLASDDGETTAQIPEDPSVLPAGSAGSRGAPPPAPLGIEIGLAYLMGSTADWAGVHQGGSVRVGLVLPGHHLAIEVDGVLTTAVVREDTGQRTSVDEFPIGIALSRRWRRDRWMVSCGPRVSVHFVHAEAIGSQGVWVKSWRTSVGLGASELLRYDGWGPIGLFAALTNEIVLPRRSFTVADQEIAGSGFFQGAFLAGVVYRFF